MDEFVQYVAVLCHSRVKLTTSGFEKGQFILSQFSPCLYCIFLTLELYFCVLMVGSVKTAVGMEVYKDEALVERKPFGWFLLEQICL